MKEQLISLLKMYIGKDDAKVNEAADKILALFASTKSFTVGEEETPNEDIDSDPSKD